MAGKQAKADFVGACRPSIETHMFGLFSRSAIGPIVQDSGSVQWEAKGRRREIRGGAWTTSHKP